MVVTKKGRPTCKHCRKAVAYRPRGLCWCCYQDRAIRALYPAVPYAVSGAMGGRKAGETKRRKARAGA